MSLQNPEFDRDDEEVATLIKFRNQRLVGAERISPIEASLLGLVESNVKGLILDFSNVEWFGSEFLNTLLRLRNKLSVQRDFKPPHSRNWLVFQVCPDRQAALHVIAAPESDPLILCALKPPLQEILRVL